MYIVKMFIMGPKTFLCWILNVMYLRFHEIYIFLNSLKNETGRGNISSNCRMSWTEINFFKIKKKSKKQRNLFNSLKFWTHCGVVTSHGYNIKCSPCSHALPIVEATKRGLPWVWEPITGPLDLTDVLTIKNTIQIQLIRLTKNENIL